MPTVAPILPLDQVLKTITPESAVKTASPQPELVRKFEALMQRQSAGLQLSTSTVHTNIAGMIERQQIDLQRVETQVQGFVDAAPGMSASELAAASMAVSRNVAVTNLKLQIVTSMAQGANRSLQTLLKNQ